MRDYLDGQKSDELFSDLCKLLLNNRCAVLVGAGLSVQAGYRRWRNGIFDGFQGEETERPGLLALAGLQETDIASYREDLPKIAQLCKESMDDARFESFIKSEFGEAGHDMYYELPHLVIWNTNFQQVLTTNFDSCLFKASNKEQCHGLFSYPTLSFREKRCLYHLHGRVYVTGNGEDEKFLIRNIVYTNQQYQEAYQTEAEIAHFLYGIVREYRLVFVAFSMEDQDFKAAFEAVNNQRIIIEKKIAREKGVSDYKPESHFVFLESPQREHFDSYQDYDERRKRTIEFEFQLEKAGFQAIRFFRQDGRYRGLARALHDMQKAAPYFALPEVGEQKGKPSPLEEASTTGN